MFSKVYLADNVGEERGLLKTTIIAKNGIFEEQTSEFGTSLTKVNDYRCLSMPEVEEYTRFSEETFPKVPASSLKCLVAWYKHITKKTGNEAQAVFYKGDVSKEVKIGGISKKVEDIRGVYKLNDDLFMYVPKQRNTKAHTQVTDTNTYDLLNKTFGMYVETHSHNTMRAFASGEDIVNSKNDGVQLVFGHLDRDEVQMYVWCTVAGRVVEDPSLEDIQRFVDLEGIEIKQQDDIFLLSIEDDTDYTKLFEELEEMIEKPIHTVYTGSAHNTKHPTTSYHQGVYGQDRFQQYTLYDYDYSDDIEGVKEDCDDDFELNVLYALDSLEYIVENTGKRLSYLQRKILSKALDILNDM